MEQEPRKATDVLLAVESKIDNLLGTLKSMDLNVKLLSNKLNEIMENQKKLLAAPQKITVEAVQTGVVNQAATLFGNAPSVDPAKMIPVTAESKLPVDDSPQGFRRTSRAESYEGDVYIKKDGVPPPRHETIPVPPAVANRPPPGRSVVDNVPTQPVVPPRNKAAAAPNTPQTPTELNTHGIVPVEQRVVDKNGKSIFLADVEIEEFTSGEQVSKSRTNGTGKWMAALPVGSYKVSIRKLESVTREKIESVQIIHIDGSQSPLKLPMVIIK